MCAPDDLSKPDVATAREVAGQMREALRRMRDSMPEPMMPLKKERWASIRSVKLYHEGEGANKLSRKVPMIPRSH